MKTRLIFFLLLSTLASQAQISVQRSTDAVYPIDVHAGTRYTLKIPVHPDTTTALARAAVDSIGLIFKEKNSSKVWVRDTSAPWGHKWSLLGAGGTITPTDTTGKWVGSIWMNASNDSLIYYKGSTRFAVKIPPGGGGSADSSIFLTIYRGDTGKVNLRNQIAAAGTPQTLSKVQGPTSIDVSISGGNTISLPVADLNNAGLVDTALYRWADSARKGKLTDTVIYREGGATGQHSIFQTQVGKTTTVTLPKFRDTSALASVITPDSALAIATHDTTSPNALQTKYRSDSARANIYAQITAKMTNYGNSPGSLKGTYAGIPAATGYPTGTEYIATDSGFHYVDTGSGGTRGWKRIAGGGSAAASLSLAAYSLAGNATNATSPAASLGMPFLYVDWFNPHKDSVTDDIAAFQACYDALPATGGMMMVGTGNYLWSTALRIKTGKPVKMIGINGKALTYGPGYASINDSSSTKIFYNQLTGPAVYNAANGTIIQNIAFICDRGTTASTNYAIYCDSGSNVIIDGNGFKNFNYNFSLRYGVQYRIVNNVSINAHSVGYNIQSYDSLNNSPLDAGDGWFIDNQAYVTPGFSYASTDTCLRVMNGGGLKIRGNKLGGSKYGAYIPWGHFSDLRIEDNSFEAVSDIPLYIKLRSGGQLANCHIMRNQFIGNGLACIKLDASAGVSVAQLEIGSNILQNRAISQDTGIVLIGTFNNSKIDRTNICNGCAVPVYTNITNGYGAGTISIDVPPGTQTVTEAARIKIDLFKGTMINLNLVNNNDTLEIVGGGTVTYFDLQMGIGANVSNIVLAGGSFNYSGGNAFNVGVQPNAVNLIHARTVTPTTYIVMGVDHRWTSNSIAFIGNNQLQEDGTEFNWNPTTNRLGLGVTTPLYAIHSLRGDGVTGFADQTNAWTKEFYTNQGNSNTNLIRLISGAGTTTSKLNGIGGMMNGLEFGYIDDLGNQRASAGIFSRLEAAPVGSTGSMPTKVGIWTQSIAQGFTTRNQPWTTGNVRQIWHSNGQIVSGILAPADTLAQGNYRQTIRGSIYLDDDSVSQPNIPSTTVLDTTTYKVVVVDASGRHFKSPWQVPGTSGPTLLFSAKNGNRLRTTDTAVVRGGALDEDTYTPGGNFSIYEGTSGSNLDSFAVYAATAYFNSTPFVGTRSANDNSTRAASTAYVDAAVGAVTSGQNFAGTADLTVANTTSFGQLLPTGIGSATAAANTLTVGKTIHVKAQVIISTKSSGTVQPTLYWWGDATGFQGAPVTLTNSMTNVIWYYEGYGTVRTTGASGTIVGYGRWFSDGGAVQASRFATTLNTTVSNTFSPGIMWDSADPSNTITVKFMEVTIK